MLAYKAVSLQTSECDRECLEYAGGAYEYGLLLCARSTRVVSTLPVLYLQLLA